MSYVKENRRWSQVYTINETYSKNEVDNRIGTVVKDNNENLYTKKEIDGLLKKSGLNNPKGSSGTKWPREFFLKEKIWENPARIFCLSPVKSCELHQKWEPARRHRGKSLIFRRSKNSDRVGKYRISELFSWFYFSVNPN